MKAPSIVVVGSSNTDMIIKVSRIPRPGETIIGSDFVTAAGGKGANQAVAAARAGGRVTFVAHVGLDPLGECAISGWRKDNIDVRHVTHDPRGPSGVALIFVAANGQNSIAVASGANARLRPSHIWNARSDLESAAILLLQLETPLDTVSAAARIARRAGVPVILNPAPARPLPDSLLKTVAVLTPNEHEAEFLTGIKVSDKAGAAKAAAALCRRGVATVIITLGARGAFVADGRTGELIRAFRVNAVDTTAAGDVFNGALAVALAEGQPLRSAVRFANAAAAISVTRPGAQPSAPTRREIDQLLRKRARNRGKRKSDT